MVDTISENRYGQSGNKNRVPFFTHRWRDIQIREDDRKRKPLGNILSADSISGKIDYNLK